MTDFPEATPGGNTLDAAQSMNAAERILLEAGWTPDDGWGGFFHGPCIGGLAPDGNFYVKNIAAIPPGHPKHSADTPDTFHEAAQWLADRYKAPASLTTEATLETPVAPEQEAVETVAHESNGETGEEADASEAEAQGEDGSLGGDFGSVRSEPDLGHDRDDTTSGRDLDTEFAGRDDESAERGIDTSEVLDADFTIEDLGHEAEQLEGPIEDFAPDEFAPEEDQSGAFIFGDNLHQMRTAAIGLVVQAAIERLPAGIDYARLAELRNFVMGVSEGRWPDDTTKRDELDTLEATERKRRGVEAVRDEKVAFLVGASREEIEDFAVDAGWPE